VEALLFIRLAAHGRALVETLLADALKTEGVRAAYLITGRYDLVVHVATGNMAALRDFALDHFTSRPEVVGVETSVMFDYGMRPQLPNLIDR
jgi:DNA-binding Lrp family transcriptional regulator